MYIGSSDEKSPFVYTYNTECTNESSYLTTFITPYGRYRFLRLNFGLKSAQDEYQRKIDYWTCYADLRGVGVVIVVDDVFVYGKSREEHANNLSCSTAYEKNEHQAQWWEVWRKSVTSWVLKADLKKVTAIKDLKPTENRYDWLIDWIKFYAVF